FLFSTAGMCQGAAGVMRSREEGQMLEKLESLYQEALGALDAVSGGDALRDWELKYFGKKGGVTELVRSVGALPKEERAAFGKRANEVKTALEAAYAEREKLVGAMELAKDLEEG